MTQSSPAFSNAEAPPVPTRNKSAPRAQKADTPRAKIELPPRRGPRERDLIDGKSEYKLVSVDDLKDDPENPRKIYRLIAELAASMKEEGLLQPVVAKIGPDGELTIMWGHRRVRAARLLNWERVPTIIRYGVVDSSILAKQLIENSHRDNLDPIDEARAIRYYMRENRIATYAECAQKLGHSLSWVANRMALHDLDDEDQAAVSEKKLSVVDGAKKARIKTGNTRVSKLQREGGHTPQHFSEEHFLAGRARSRCVAGRNKGETHKPVLGGVACGSCWEVVIRLDARRNPDALAGNK